MFPLHKTGIGVLGLAAAVVSTLLATVPGAFAQSATDIIRDLAPIEGQGRAPAPPPVRPRPNVGPGPGFDPGPGPGPGPGFDPGPGPGPGPGFDPGPGPGAGFGPGPGPAGPGPAGPGPAGPGPGFGPGPGPGPGFGAGPGFDPGSGPGVPPGAAAGFGPRVEDTDVFIDGRQSRAYVDYSRAIDLTIYFEYNSARVTERAREVLDRLGEALASPELQRHRFLIAGHTDAVGTDEFNFDLSYRRALAVRDYLARTHNINPHRIAVKGWGRTRLKDRVHADSGINRRVEVALIVDRGTAYLESEQGLANTQYPGRRPWYTCPPGSRLIDPQRPDMNLDDFAAGAPNPMCRPIDDGPAVPR